jgi:50S ribosomal subunit-associated GTPase HflX
MYIFLYVYIFLHTCDTYMYIYIYIHIGKSTLLNRLSCAGVLAENMLFATLDPTTRRVRLPKNKVDKSEKNEEDNQEIEYNQDTIIEVNEMNVRNKGQEVLLTDTVGFISKLPTGKHQIF